MADTKFKLKHPFEFSGEKVSELSFRRPKGKDIKAALAKGEAEFVFVLFGNLCERSAELIEEFDIEDLDALNNLMDGWGIRPNK